jgi:hypothetical protein
MDANGLALAHLYGQPPDAVAFSDKRLTNDEAQKLARLITCQSAMGGEVARQWRLTGQL